eukprot:CAMPEP_0178980584 /NCGR_PEP_ID=MMETSP0789-20121207/26578_1 /TAXON_ID=3005 /ORGANISM="Rhizosolenia setigera, Strain CCMP 1694" /LENGTH=596 /DNA_ID=CAMNT_0020671015 /DNA_START=21 /DNA_END=1811 /DNA_ORIENTATION=+
MSLGLTRDSVLDLAGLGAAENSSEPEPYFTPESKASEDNGDEFLFLDESDGEEERKSNTVIRNIPTVPSEIDPDVSSSPDNNAQTGEDSISVIFNTASVSPPNYPVISASSSEYSSAPTSYGSQSGSGEGGLFRCLFPFLFNNKETSEKSLSVKSPEISEFPSTITESEMNQNDIKRPQLEEPPNKHHNSGNTEENKTQSAKTFLGKDSTKTDEESKAEIDQYGSPLTDSQRQAVMNRLRLQNFGEEKKESAIESPTPDLPETDEPSQEEEIGSGSVDSSSISSSIPKMPKGILKNSTTQKSDERLRDSTQRRSLFNGVTYDEYNPKQEKGDTKFVDFSPMAKVLTVPGRHHYPPSVKDLIWWTRKDYQDFKKTGRIISMAMLTGGSEIWLYSDESKNSKTSASEEVENFGEKWWCKFGHSRRGLEHVVCFEEGQHRQQNVVKAIKAVVNEQQRQMRHNINDPTKIANAPARFTAYARDLALAAGMADAEVVRSDFCSKAKSRGHYKDVYSKNYLHDRNMMALDSHTHPSRKQNSYSQTQNKKNTGVSTSSVKTRATNTSNITKKASGFGQESEDDVDRMVMKIGMNNPPVVAIAH